MSEVKTLLNTACYDKLNNTHNKPTHSSYDIICSLRAARRSATLAIDDKEQGGKVQHQHYFITDDSSRMPHVKLVWAQYLQYGDMNSHDRLPV